MVPSTGAMNPSPQGRFPKAPGWASSPASGMPVRPSRPILRSEPLGHVIRAPDPAVSSSAIARPFLRSASMSALIIRASMSSVTPGSVATRTPASVAALRAAVCESDWTVGAMTTSAATIPAAMGAGGSAACESALGHHSQRSLGASRLGLRPQALPETLRDGIADHQHVLALAHPQAVADHRPDRLLELAHRPAA